MAEDSRLMVGQRKYPNEVGCEKWGQDYTHKAGEETSE